MGYVSQNFRIYVIDLHKVEIKKVEISIVTIYDTKVVEEGGGGG